MSSLFTNTHASITVDTTVNLLLTRERARLCSISLYSVLSLLSLLSLVFGRIVLNTEDLTVSVLRSRPAGSEEKELKKENQ